MTSDEVAAKANEIEAAIQSREGVVLKHVNPIAWTLSYQIKKRASGFFGVFEFQIEPEKLLEIKAIVEKDKKIVRHMLIIKRAAEFKKARRTRESAQKKLSVEETPVLTTEQETKVEEPKEEQEAVKTPDNKGKVELKDIEDKLEELLG